MLDRLAIRIALALAVGAALAYAEPAHSQTWRTVSSARQVAGEHNLNVKLEYGAGRLRVEPAKQDLLYRFEMQYDEDRVRPVTQYDRTGGVLRVGMEDRRDHGGSGRMHGGHATVGLNPAVPVDLQMEFGAGEADLDLGGLSLQRVSLETGASDTRVSFSSPNRIDADRVRLEAGAAQLYVSGLGNTRAARIDFSGGVGHATLDFGGSWTRDAQANLEMGIGSLTLRFPRDLGVRITKDSFLASFDHEGLVKRGDSWYSRNWDSAARKLTVNVDAAFGSIDVQWMD